MNLQRLWRVGKRYLRDENYRFLIAAARGKYDDWSDERYLRRKFAACMGKELNLTDPKTFNEKLQWLKLYWRKPEFSTMVDKYKAREFVAERIGEKYLIPILGVWSDPDEIDFDALPERFVLKCNHNSGLGMCICKDKSRLNVEQAKENLRRGLRQNYYLTGREWPYKNVEPRIVGEEYMEDKSGELKDYKFYCFDGEAKMLMIASNRFSEKPTCFDYFDREYRRLPIVWGNPVSEVPPPKPSAFDEMLKIADELSRGIPHVRVDLYECDSRVYFGETTFFDNSGFGKFDEPEWDETVGEWLRLPKID